MYVQYDPEILERVYRAIHEISKDIPATCIKTPEPVVVAIWCTASEQIDHRGEGDLAIETYPALKKSEVLASNIPDDGEYTKVWEAALQEASEFETQVYVACVCVLALAPLEEYPQMFWNYLLPKVNRELSADRFERNATIDKALGEAWQKGPK